MQKGEMPVLKALAIGILLIPANHYWIAHSEMVLFNFPTIVVPFYNVIVSLLVLMIFSLLLRKISPKSALSHRDLLIIYIILSIASSIGSTSMTQEMPEAMSHGFWFATKENEWETLIWKHIPRWLTVNNKDALKDVYEGDSSLYVVENIVPFLRVFLQIGHRKTVIGDVDRNLFLTAIEFDVANNRNSQVCAAGIRKFLCYWFFAFYHLLNLVSFD